MELKQRSVDFEVKQITEEDGFFKFEGLASTFGNEDTDGDIILEGAFKESLQIRSPLILWQHDTRQPIGMPERMAETSLGLEIVGKLPKNDTFVSGRVIPQMEIGSIRSMSIGFFIPVDGATISSDGTRVIRKIDLFEVSLVSFPANERALVSGFKQNKFNVDQIESLETIRQIEDFLKDSGTFSKASAKALISKICDTRRDAEQTKDNADNAARWDADMMEELTQLKELARGSRDGNQNRRGHAGR